MLKFFERMIVNCVGHLKLGRPCRLLLAFGLIIWLATIFSAPLQAQKPEQTTVTPTILTSNENGIVLVWTLPDYTVTETVIEGRLYSQVQIENLRLSDEPGFPQLPIYRTLIGLPQTGAATLTLVNVEQTTVILSHPPVPAPVPQPVQMALTPVDELPTAAPIRHMPDLAAYQKDQFYPGEVAQLGSPEILRENRVAHLAINPIAVNPITGEMKIIHRVEIAIQFEQPATLTRNRPDKRDLFAEGIKSTLLNPQAVNWQMAPNRAKGSSMLAGNNQGLKVVVGETGLYIVTYADLQNVGLSLASLDPKTFKLYHGYPRQEIPLQVIGEADGRFDPADYILFVADPVFSRYASLDAYFLEYGGAAGARIQLRADSGTDPLPAGTAWREASAEVNKLYDTWHAGRDGDHWYWDKLSQPDDTTGRYTLPLVENPLPTGPAANLTVWLEGYTKDRNVTPDHRVAAFFADKPVGEVSWDGVQSVVAEFNIPASDLINGQNHVDLTLPGTGTLIEGVWVDALTLTYPTNLASAHQFTFSGEAEQRIYHIYQWNDLAPIVYDITDPQTPTQVADISFDGYTLSIRDHDASVSTYLVVPYGTAKAPTFVAPVQPYTDPPNGADYIIITHPDFAATIAPLAQHRANENLRTFTVDVRAIYDHFGEGRGTPQAIKNFLTHAYKNWVKPTPLYVLLVGDGHHDPKNHFGWNNPNFIPPFLANVDRFTGETATDNQFVTVAGSDHKPAMLIGRLSVSTPAEVTTIVNKIINYETNPAPGLWQNYHLFVADDPDTAGNFHRNADLGYNELKPPFLGQRFYLDTTNPTLGSFYQNRTDLRQAFLGKFNQGVGMVTYHGHSSWHQWAGESLLQWNLNNAENDVLQLTNGNRLPFVMGMTCMTGYFHHPEYPTLDESLVRQPGGGAIAAWGSTGFGVATQHHILQETVYAEIVNKRETRLGSILLTAKVTLDTQSTQKDLIETFVLLGDPALKLNLQLVPLEKEIMLPLVFR